MLLLLLKHRLQTHIIKAELAEPLTYLLLNRANLLILSLEGLGNFTLDRSLVIGQEIVDLSEVGGKASLRILPTLFFLHAHMTCHHLLQLDFAKLDQLLSLEHLPLDFSNRLWK